MKIVVLGGGPCGLGAAWRLNELEHREWILFEASDRWGGLSASFTDPDGFCWDIGGHVLFSHYSYFDRAMDVILGGPEGWVSHEREAWIYMQNRFVPYPLQNNIHRLPRDVFWECLQGIVDIQECRDSVPPADFGQWIEATFGSGLAKWFMRPYNWKVWAFPPEEMDWSWVGERVAPVDLKSILKNAVYEKDSIAWGPNALFRFPLNGGTGAVWKAMAKRLPSGNLFLNRKVDRISVRDKAVHLRDGSTESYDVLISTIPLPDLLAMANPDVSNGRASSLRSSAIHIVGLALKRPMPDTLTTKCWMYFPEDNCPFYRVTVFSNYSPNNVPDRNAYWSLMCEVSKSARKPVDRKRVVEDVIDGALRTGLIQSRTQVHHSWSYEVEKGYPTPTLNRNRMLFPLLSDLETHGIYSRGRFGAWRYEVGNMDHSFMQGVELANRLLARGEELTLWYPQVVNNVHPSGRKR